MKTTAPETAQPACSPCAAAITAIDVFIQTLRRHRSPSQFATSLDHFLALQTALDSAERSLAAGQLLTEPLRSNYRARLQTLAFELHRLQPLLQQEHSRFAGNLHRSTTRRSWLSALARTQ